MKNINDMTGREVADFVIGHMERGEEIMLASREGTEFAKGFRFAIAGLKGGLRVAEGESSTAAFLNVLPALIAAAR